MAQYPLVLILTESSHKGTSIGIVSLKYGIMNFRFSEIVHGQRQGDVKSVKIFRTVRAMASTTICIIIRKCLYVIMKKYWEPVIRNVSRSRILITEIGAWS
jgi:hypothetical protein